MYDVRIHREALKSYRRLDKELQIKIDEAVEKLGLDPWRRDLDVKKLHGEYKGYYRLRIGEVRLIYTIDRENGLVYIDALAHRGGAYK
ncbi:type II toxin-antitoxin system RelE family toxin [Desulfofundulus thermobenzoicus]|nr:type II toxin-antitoxin system RelE/ParE family toxin [Desulfofundulus thermobenzoicus]